MPSPILDYILLYLEPFLTILGGLSIIKTLIFIYLYFNEKERYIEFTIEYYNTDEHNIKQMKNAPIRDELDLYKIGNFGSSDLIEYFKIGCPGKVIKQIKLMELTIGNSRFSNKLKYKHLKNVNIANIQPNEFLLVKTISFETAPQYKLICRVDGAKVEIHFSNSGLYGMHDTNYIRAKNDLYSFFHQFFRNMI